MVWRGFLIGGHIKPAIAMTVFVVFFAMVSVTGDITQVAANADNLEDMNITEEDLKIAPDLPEVTEKEIDLEDYTQSENIRVDDSEDVNNTEFSSDKVLSLKNSSESGWVMYGVASDTDVVLSESKKYSFWHTGDQIELEQYDNPNTNSTPLDESLLSGEMSTNAHDDVSYIRFNIPANQDEAYLYSVTQQQGDELSSLGSIAAYVDSAATAIGAWFSLLTGLPEVLLWLGVVFGIVGTIIVLEVILW